MKPMARKQPKGTKAMIAAEADVKSVRLELSPDVHKQFRIEAAKEGQSMAALAKRLIEDWVSKRKGGK
jgi:predicted HicB family RNase H-like nuclease